MQRFAQARYLGQAENTEHQHGISVVVVHRMLYNLESRTPERLPR